jgi:hypothetical protein
MLSAVRERERDEQEKVLFCLQAEFKGNLEAGQAWWHTSVTQTT